MTPPIKTLAAAVTVALLAGNAFAQSASEAAPKPLEAGTVADSSSASPIYGVTIPAGYRDWKVISVSQLSGKANQLRVELGNDIAIKAFRDGTLPFPNGAIVAALHWNAETPDDNNKILATLGVQSMIAGAPVNVQFMVKDSKKYAATAGWGFADFKDGKASDEALHQKCFGCHVPAKDRDYIYTRYARTP
jgi:Cytochrome P460